jgi:hypothetical protein
MIFEIEDDLYNNFECHHVFFGGISFPLLPSGWMSGWHTMGKIQNCCLQCACFLGEPIVAMVVLAGVIIATILIPMSKVDTYPGNTCQLTMIVLVSIVFGIPALIAFLLYPVVLFVSVLIWYSMVWTSSTMLLWKTLSYTFIGMYGQAMLDYCHWK